MLIRYAIVFVAAGLILTGCPAPSEYRQRADRVAADIIADKQRQALGRCEPFDIHRPADVLRRRLLIDQHLPHAGRASLGTDRLEAVAHWPDDDYPAPRPSSAPVIAGSVSRPLQVTLSQALQIGARNSFDYQSKKEAVFRSSLDLDLARERFRSTFSTRVEGSAAADRSGNDAVSGAAVGGAAAWARTLKSGAEFGAALTLDLVKLLTQDGASSLGILGDATITIPLLRGSGRHIVTEPLTQAERNVIYAIWDLERFKKTFAVAVASDFLRVLGRGNEVENAAENYRNLVAATQRSRQLANAGRTTEIQVDQAFQNALRARNRWISATASHRSALDAFKGSLGLPPDAAITLDPGALDRLAASAPADIGVGENLPSADPSTSPVPPGFEGSGTLEKRAAAAIGLGLQNRLDLRIFLERIRDAQRNVVVLADRLGAELTLFGSASQGERRSLSTADEKNARLRPEKGIYTALFTVDLPLERTAERNEYRNGLIALEAAVRAAQEQEDRIKLEIRNALRDMVEASESLDIQARAVGVAEKRAKSTALFYEAGRAQIRDLLEAQESLISARNALTSARVRYRVAQWEFERDTGRLAIDARGLWHENGTSVGGN